MKTESLRRETTSLGDMRRDLRERFERLKEGNPSPDISKSLREQMTAENLIRRRDLWNFIEEHKDQTKDQFGGWLILQEVRRTDKMIMAVDLWNDMVYQKLKEELYR